MPIPNENGKKKNKKKLKPLYNELGKQKNVVNIAGPLTEFPLFPWPARFRLQLSWSKFYPGPASVESGEKKMLSKLAPRTSRCGGRGVTWLKPSLHGWDFVRLGVGLYPNDGVIIKYAFLFLGIYCIWCLSNMTPKKMRRARFFVWFTPSRKDHIAAGNDIHKVFRRKLVFKNPEKKLSLRVMSQNPGWRLLTFFKPSLESLTEDFGRIPRWLSLEPPVKCFSLMVLN